MIFSAEASVYYGPVALRLLSKSVYFVIILLVRVDKVCGVTADNHKPLEQSLGRVCSLGSLARENRWLALACRWLVHWAQSSRILMPYIFCHHGAAYSFQVTFEPEHLLL